MALQWREILHNYGLPNTHLQAGIYEVIKITTHEWTANVYPTDLQSWASPECIGTFETLGEAMQACEDHMITEITRRLCK